VTYAGAANTFAATTTVATNSVTMTVGSAGAAARSYTVTLTGATMGPPIAASVMTGVSVSTTTDAAGIYPATPHSDVLSLEHHSQSQLPVA